MPFFILSLSLYLILLGILLCIWRCRSQPPYIQTYIEGDNLRNCTKVHNETYFVPLQPKSSTKKELPCSCNKNNCTFCLQKDSKSPKYIILNQNTFEIDQCNVMPQSGTPTEEHEYFIGNVSAPKVCMSEVFLFVEDVKPQEQPVEISVIKEILED